MVRPYVWMQEASDVTAGKAARKRALAPGGVLTSRFMARHPVVLQIGSNIFVHAGLLPSHVDYGLERINRWATACLLQAVEKSVSQCCTLCMIGQGQCCALRQTRAPALYLLMYAFLVAEKLSIFQRQQSKADTTANWLWLST